MSVESAYDRVRKVIVETTVAGFTTADEAVRFGNTVQTAVEEKTPVKFCQFIGSPETAVAITRWWQGETCLKMTFMEFSGNDTAAFICDTVKRMIKAHNFVHRASISLSGEVVRGKPQPQFAEVDHVKLDTLVGGL